MNSSGGRDRKEIKSPSINERSHRRILANIGSALPHTPRNIASNLDLDRGSGDRHLGELGNCGHGVFGASDLEIGQRRKGVSTRSSRRKVVNFRD